MSEDKKIVTEPLSRACPLAFLSLQNQSDDNVVFVNCLKDRCMFWNAVADDCTLNLFLSWKIVALSKAFSDDENISKYFGRFDKKPDVNCG